MLVRQPMDIEQTGISEHRIVRQPVGKILDTAEAVAEALVKAGVEPV